MVAQLSIWLTPIIRFPINKIEFVIENIDDRRQSLESIFQIRLSNYSIIEILLLLLLFETVLLQFMWKYYPFLLDYLDSPYFLGNKSRTGFREKRIFF